MSYSIFSIAVVRKQPKNHSAPAE